MSRIFMGCMKKTGLWRRDERGSTAVEFALVSLPFFTMLIGMVETSLFFASGNVLEGAAHEAARVLQTGQAQQSADPVGAFEDRLCEKVGIMIPCEDIVYEVVTLPAFTDAADYAPQFDAEGNLDSQGFSPGSVEDTILVRVSYRYNFLTPMLGEMMSGGDGSSMLHMATVIVRNEPYEFE